MATNPLLATPNGAEQARTTKPFPNLPKPTNINHPSATIARKTRHILHRAAGEKFPFNHQPTAETAPRPNSDPPTNAARPQRTSANRTEQARTTKAFPDPPQPTNINHPTATISRETRHILHRTGGEKFLFNHQPATETVPRPNSDPPRNAAPRQRTRTNATEQARTPRTNQNLPTPTKLNHPDRTISCKTRRFPLRAVGEKFLFNHQPTTKSPAHPNNAPAANLDESAASGRVV